MTNILVTALAAAGRFSAETFHSAACHKRGFSQPC